MNMNECDKFALLATLESQQTILLYAKQEYGRLLKSLDNCESDAATRALTAVDQNSACLNAILDEVNEQHDTISSEGEKICGIDYDNNTNQIYRGIDNGCVCQRQIAEIMVELHPIPNICSSQLKLRYYA